MARYLANFTTQRSCYQVPVKTRRVRAIVLLRVVCGALGPAGRCKPPLNVLIGFMGSSNFKNQLAKAGAARSPENRGPSLGQLGPRAGRSRPRRRGLGGSVPPTKPPRRRGLGGGAADEALPPEAAAPPTKPAASRRGYIRCQGTINI